MKIEGSISITRPQGPGEEYIKISIRDENACVGFVEVNMGLANFAKAVTSLQVPCEIEVRGLEKVGKKHEHKTFEFKIADTIHDRNENAIKEIKKICPKGWEPDLYFSSQNSFFYKDGEYFARTTIRRWVAPQANNKKCECGGIWKTDGYHQNQFCSKCFKTKGD